MIHFEIHYFAHIVSCFANLIWMNPFKFCSCYFVESMEANLFREHKDRVGEGRALYNLGNVFHAKGKENLLGKNCNSLSKD